MAVDPDAKKLARAMLDFGGPGAVDRMSKLLDLIRDHAESASIWQGVAEAMAEALAERRREEPPFRRALARAERQAAARILLTEDDADVRTLVEDALLDEGYRVDATDTVASALSLLGAHNYDLLLTDGRLPDGSGLTVADQAAEQGTKVMVFSGYVDEFPRTELSRYMVVRKPADMDYLVQRVSDLIDA